MQLLRNFRSNGAHSGVLELWRSVMAPTLYMFHGSPPVRAVLITSRALGISLDFHELKYLAGDLFKPEYLKLNPQHTVPTLDDDGNVICESHAINAYLVGKYGKDDSLYPKDLYKRALVDQRLHFDSGVLFPLFKSVAIPVFKQEIKEIPPKKLVEFKEAYGFLEKFLEGHQWVAGGDVTIADFSCVTIITALNVLVPLDPTAYPNVANWLKRVQALPYVAPDAEELDLFQRLYQKMLSSHS